MIRKWFWTPLYRLAFILSNVFGVIALIGLVIVSVNATSYDSWIVTMRAKVFPVVLTYATLFLSTYYIKWEFVHGPQRKDREQSPEKG